MKNKTLTALMIVVALSAACSFGLFGDDVYENEKFSVRFPGGKANVVSAEWTSNPLFEGDLQLSRYWYKDSSIIEKIFQRTPDMHVYSVWESEQIDVEPGVDGRSILSKGLRGLDRFPGTEMKYVTINGREALDAVYTAGLTRRSVIFWSDRNRRLYKVEIQSERKEDVSNEEANDFVDSFRLKDR